MPIFLKHRQPDLFEEMDKDDCNLNKLENTYRQFHRINVLLSNWKRIYRTYLLPLMHDSTVTYSLLDIGFGGGDIPLSISKWAKQDGIQLQITAIETDQRAFGYVQSLSKDRSVTFLNCSSTDLVLQNKCFDFVISNHLLHHLYEKNILQILEEAKSLSNHLVIFNDIKRSDLGYLLFNIFSRLLFRNSFITKDGLTSIKRCFTFQELKQFVPQGWNRVRSFPFRLLLIFERDHAY